MKSQNEIPMIAIRITSLTEIEINELKKIIKEHNKNSDCFDGPYIVHDNINAGCYKCSNPKWRVSYVPNFFYQRVTFQDFKDFINN